MTLIRRNGSTTPGIPNSKAWGAHALPNPIGLQVHNLQQVVLTTCQDAACRTEMSAFAQEVMFLVP